MTDYGAGMRDESTNQDAVRDRLLLAIFAAGLFLSYMWPAIVAPVVTWSDSTIDLDWARRGLGILSPAADPTHGAKPGYLLFLRTALAVSGNSTRSVVILQSLAL